MVSRIYSIVSVDLSLIKTNPPGLLITAAGMVTSSGWSAPKLNPFTYVQPPADGILDCDFVATPPTSEQIILPVVTPIAADLALNDIDLANYWGTEQPLVGVRCHSVGNSKTAFVAEDRAGMPAMRVLSTESVSMSPSFDADIKNLFRSRDVNVMKARSGFDLHDHNDVSKWADRILERLETDNPVQLMPCDGRWPQTDIDLFKAWIEAGKPA